MAGNTPNVILCVCDQLRAFDVGCYGHPMVQTPHIDQLAARGIRFDTAVTNNPVCTPARSCLLSGQYSRTCNGVTGNCDDPVPERRHIPGTSLAECYRDAGYQTASIGKWHMPSRPDTVGFEHWVYPTVPHRHRHRLYFDSARPDGFQVDNWTWDYDYQRVVNLLDQRDDRPFFLYYNIEPPHMPLDDAPEHYRTLHDPATVPIRDNAWIDGSLARDEHWFRIYLWDYLYYREHLPYTEQLPEGFDLRQLTAGYLGMVTLVDDMVGKLCGTLESRELLEDTIFMFVSDHGDVLGSHGHFNKSRFWEECIRIPLIAAGPGIRSGQVITDQLAASIDVMPTLLGLSGLRFPQGLHGTDLAPVLNGSTRQAGDNLVFLEAVKDGIAVRTPTHLYGMALRDMSTQEHHPANDEIVDERRAFYDLRTDPFEQENLAGTGAQPEVAEKLRERLTRWHRETPWKKQL